MLYLRKRFVFTFAILLLCSAYSLAQQASLQPLSDSTGKWLLLEQYSDEFNSNQLDTVKWNNRLKPWGLWTWRPENVYLADSVLHLVMRYQPHERKKKKLYYTSGAIKSKNPPLLYGYFEARIKAVPRYPGVCSAFWIYRRTKEMWTEIDFVELMQNRRHPRQLDFFTHVFIHPLLEQQRPLRKGQHWIAPWNPSDDFHVYGCQWNERDMRWYVDGKMVAIKQNKYWHQALDLILSMGLRRPLKENPSPQGFPTETLVDYVRVWKHKKEN